MSSQLEQCDDARSVIESRRVAAMIAIGDGHARLGKLGDAIHSYQKVLQPRSVAACGAGTERLAQPDLYAMASRKLRFVATSCAQQMIEQGCYLSGTSPSDNAIVARGALHLYLISNQYDAFLKRSLNFAIEQLAERNIKRFLMSMVRKRLSDLSEVHAHAFLLPEERAAFDMLAQYERKLDSCLAPLVIRSADRRSHDRIVRAEK